MHHIKYTNVRNGKMTLVTFSVFTVVLLLSIYTTWWFTRCYYNNHEATNKAFLQLDSSLYNCNRFLLNNNRTIADEIDENLKDPARREKALLWSPKAKSALIITQSIQQYLQELKGDLRGSGEYKRLGSKKSYFYKPDISEGLFDSLNNFNYYLTDLIPKERIDQLGVLPVQALVSGKQTNNKDEWYQYNFENLDITATIVMLSKIETDVLRSTNIVLNFMNNQNESLIYHDEFYIPLTSQNSMFFLPGQTLEITAGIGAYTRMSNPTIKINNNYIPVNDQGIGVYKQTITGEKGDSVIVTISYKDPNTGELRSIWKSINYTVLQPLKN